MERIKLLESKILFLRRMLYYCDSIPPKEYFDAVFEITTQKEGEVMVKNGDSLPEITNEFDRPFYDPRNRHHSPGLTNI